MIKKATLIFFLLFVIVYSAISQTTFYDLNVIQKIEIYFSQSNWDYQMDTAKAGYEGYIMADWIKVNGTYYDSVGVKYKGNSSYNSTNAKNPLHIELDAFKNQSFQGIKDIKLGNGYADPSMIREVLSYSMLSNYMDCPRANFAQVYINGAYAGLYSNAESINKKFLSDHFNSSQHTFFKCNPVINPGPATKSNLKYITGGDSSNYSNFYEIKTGSWAELVALCDSVTNHSDNLGSIMDMDRVIWMLAFNTVLVNLDSYSGVFAQNYYLYLDKNERYVPIIWDLNMCLGGFPYLGSGGTGMGSLTVTNMQQLPLNIHATDPFWPLINAVANNASRKKMYVAHMKTILNEMFTTNSYQTQATQLQSLVDTAVQSDQNKFFSYTQFQNGLTSNATVGSYTVPGIGNLMNARTTYLQNTTEFNYTAPSIINIVPSSTNPALNSNVSFTAQITNLNNAWLGYRFNSDEKFIKVQMFDDGLHNDGASGDNTFGASFNMSEPYAQYYIYAENSNAGIFSPARAEHEFYTINATIQSPSTGELVINEFLAINQSGVMDESDQYADWIELFNNTNNTINLNGLYLSDDYSNPLKFGFPSGTSISPHSYLIVWADEDSTIGTNIHCNFKLSSGGEQIILSDMLETVIDSVSFGPQTADVSMARCPNGTGAFESMHNPTYAAANCATGIEENSSTENITIYPLPANEYFFLTQNFISNEMVMIYNSLGELKYSFRNSGKSLKINSSDWNAGIYFIKQGKHSKKVLIIH